MDRYLELKKEVDEIKKRNKRVEENKAWETSIIRKLSIAILTYITIVLFFLITEQSKPFVNAIVPTVGFLLSTLTLDIIRKLWSKKYLSTNN